MSLDTNTLLFINVANVLVMSLTLPLIMGQRLSTAARDARLSLILNGLAWAALVISGLWRGQWPDWALSSLAMVLFGLSNWRAWRALSGWLGPRPLGRTLAVLVVALPIGYALTFWSYPIRVGWANLLFAAQLMVLARATLQPQAEFSGQGNWRYVLFACFGVMAVFTALRGILGAWFTELYPYFRAPTPVNVAAMVAANVTLVMANVAVLVAWREEAEQRLRELIVTDPLTGLLNRTGWTQQAENALRQARRSRQALAVVMLDLDHFKLINDTHGHEAGDSALCSFGLLLQNTQRAGDVCARLGGEEFGVLLLNAGVEAARGYDERLRAALAAATLASLLPVPLNFSCGVAVCRDDNESLESIMARADAALYRAKRGGRGCMELADAAEDDGLTTRPPATQTPAEALAHRATA